ncbi:MAG: hypothetical protein RL757_3067 [Bacteroidota bacterium]|jgi:hypothetical protein
MRNISSRLFLFFICLYTYFFSTTFLSAQTTFATNQVVKTNSRDSSKTAMASVDTLNKKDTLTQKKMVVALDSLQKADSLAVKKEKPIKYIDTIYYENIFSIKFNPINNPIGMPIIELGNGALNFSFDDLDGDIKDFVYTVEHCNADWTPSELEQQEYLDAFDLERVRRYQAGFNTLVPFMHYDFSLPNENFKIKKSGNYLLKIYEDLGDKRLVMTRRFVIYEQKTGVIRPKYTFSEASTFRTNQEFDLSVGIKNLRSVNPIKEIKMKMIQNGRWDQSITVPPLMTIGDSLLFDYQNVITFKAGKEFRLADFRSNRFRSERVAKITRGDETWEYRMLPDRDRFNEPYFSYRDADGSYIIENSHEDDDNLQSDYIIAQFSLPMNEPLDSADAYIVGPFSDWQLRRDYKMEFRESANEVRGYHADIYLKQGFYNYLYAVKYKNKPEPDFTSLEGNWFETDNQYTVLLYQRPFGGRYDQVVGYLSFHCNGR